VDERRDRLDEMIYAVMEANPEYLQIYAVWRPNALDGLDAQMIGRVGSSPTGQYAMCYTRETGEILPRATVDIDATIAYLNSLNINNPKDRVEPPFQRSIAGKDTYVIRMMKPIINDSTKQAVGGIAYLMNIDSLQQMLEQTVRENDEITAMGLFANDGTILAHSFSDRIGVSDAFWSVMIAAREDYILSEVNDLTKLTILLAIIIAAAVTVVIYFVLHFTMMPVVNVAATLKDIAQGEGDLTVKIAEKGKDEITELSRYFNQTIEKIRALIVIIKNEGNILSGMNEMALGAEQINIAVTQVNDISVKNRDAINKLIQEVNRFKVE